MARVLAGLAIVALLWTGQASARDVSGPPAEPFHTLKYVQIIETIKYLAGDSPTGIFRDLRRHYLLSRYYRQYQSDPLVIPSGVLMGEIKGGAALKAKARRFIDDNFALASSHLLYLNTFPEEKGTRTYDIHRMALQRLFNMLRNSGNGASAQSAIKVLVISEQYAFLRAFRYRIAGQERINIDGSTYDVFDVLTNERRPLKLWFNVDPLVR